MNTSRRAVGGLAVAVALMASACGNPADEGGAVSEVVVAYPADVDTLDPHMFRSAAAYGVVGNIYATLLQEDYAEPVDGVLEYTGRSTPYLAESATWNAERTRLSLRLRPDATAAAGKKLTAQDVVWSLRRALSDIGYASAIGSWLNITDPATDVVAVDDSTVELRVTHYSPLIEKFLTFQIFPILDSAAAEAAATQQDPWATGFFAKDATESGPYVIEAQVPGQSTTLGRNPRFPAGPGPDRVVVQNMPDPQQAFLALQNGAVDLVVGLPPDLARAVDEDPDLRLYDLPYSEVAFIGMDNEDPVLRDVRVRQAISHLMPYQALRDDVMKGYAGSAYGAVPYPMTDALDETGERVAYPTDVAKAKALLAEAGIGEGQLALTLSVPVSDAVLRQSAVFIQSALGQAGIRVAVNEMSDADFNTNLPNLQMYLDTWYSWGQDSVFQMYFLLKTGVFTNSSGFSSPEVDALIEKAMATTDPAERRALSQQAQQVVIDQAPWAFLFTRNMLIGARPEVTGITHSDDANLRFDRLRISPS